MSKSKKFKNKSAKKHRFIHRTDGKKEISRKNISDKPTDEKEVYFEDENFVFIQKDLKKIGFIIGFIFFTVFALYFLNLKIDISNFLLFKIKF